MMELDNDTRNALADLVERLEALHAEKKQAADAIKAEMAQAASQGFDVKVIRQLLKDRAADDGATVEHRALVETYRKALAGMQGSELGEWARNWIAQGNTVAARAEPRDMQDFMAKRAQARRATGDDAGEEGRPS